MRYLKQYRKVRYYNLLTSGKPNGYLANLDRQAEEMFSRLIKQLAEKEGVTEAIKAENQMLWVQKMNSIRNANNLQNSGIYYYFDTKEEIVLACAEIVKDHSRLGRNRLIVGQLLEEGFDRLGVRYIAIMDNIDTAKGIRDLVPMQDLFNEWHAKNTSQKVRNVFKSKGMSGAPLTTNPPYGYLKDPENKNGWLLDEEAAKTMRQIFAWCVDGLGPTQIAKRLKAAKVLTPTEHWSNIGRNCSKPPAVRIQWQISYHNKL